MSNANQNDVVTDESGLRFYGIGIVTKNKPRNTDFIMVAPIEKVSGGKGRLADVENVFEVDSVDVNGIASKEKVTGEAHIKAKWFPLSEGNRQTAPDVIEGETVRLWKYGNEDEYYWQTMYREPGIRRLETVLYCYGNLPKGNTVWDKDSSYWEEVSTHDQHWWFKTTQSNGEAYGYDIKLDTKNSTYRINDNVGNMWLLDSPNTLIRFYNVDGSFVDIDKDTYWGYARKHMKHESAIIHMKTPMFIVTAREENDFHSRAFLMIDHDGNRAQMGSGNDSYMHTDNGDMDVYARESIDEETRDKRIRSETRDIESEQLTERYGTVRRTTRTYSESLSSFERTAGDSKEDYGNREMSVKDSKESYGSQDKTADKVTEKVSDQKSEVDKLEQTSKEQSIKSDTMQEEYGKQDLKVGEKSEEVKSVKTNIEEKEEKEVGDYLMNSKKNIDLRSEEGILLTDTTISNLKVPGKIQLGSEDLGDKLQAMVEKDGQMSSDIEDLDQRVTILEDELKQVNDMLSESKETVDEAVKKNEEMEQAQSDAGNRISATEDEINKLKQRVIKLEEEMVEAFKRIEENAKRIEEVAAAAAAAAEAAAAAASAAAAAQSTANDASAAAAAAQSTAESAASTSSSGGDAAPAPTP